jgi:hypothetical protein
VPWQLRKCVPRGRWHAAESPKCRIVSAPCLAIAALRSTLKGRDNRFCRFETKRRRAAVRRTVKALSAGGRRCAVPQEPTAPPKPCPCLRRPTFCSSAESRQRRRQPPAVLGFPFARTVPWQLRKCVPRERWHAAGSPKCRIVSAPRLAVAGVPQGHLPPQAAPPSRAEAGAALYSEREGQPSFTAFSLVPPRVLAAADRSSLAGGGWRTPRALAAPPREKGPPKRFLYISPAKGENCPFCCPDPCNRGQIFFSRPLRSGSSPRRRPGGGCPPAPPRSAAGGRCG